MKRLSNVFSSSFTLLKVSLNTLASILEKQLKKRSHSDLRKMATSFFVHCEVTQSRRVKTSFNFGKKIEASL